MAGTRPRRALGQALHDERRHDGRVAAGAERASHGVGRDTSLPHVRRPARLPAVRPPYASRSSAAGRGDGPLRADAGVWGRLARTEQRALAERSFRRCTTSGATARVTACVDYGGHGVGHAFAVAGAANRRAGRGVTGGCGRADAGAWGWRADRAGRGRWWHGLICRMSASGRRVAAYPA